MNVLVRLRFESPTRHVGLLKETTQGIAFQYDPEFLKAPLPVSPIALPPGSGVWRSKNALFEGLPGFVADSLPDGWGRLILERRLRARGLPGTMLRPLARLCAVGDTGMGALEYVPADLPEETHEVIGLDRLADGAEAILADAAADDALDDLCRLNGSSGGACPKIVCLVSEDRRTLVPGHMTEGTMRPWVVKFRSALDPTDAGALEYAVSILAKKAGIRMPATHLFASAKGPGWFGIERFDRTPEGKVHMVTAAGLLHCDFRLPSLDYLSLAALTRRLCGREDTLELVRRAYFNFVIGNEDDHAKNFSFLMDAEGRWRLSPAYDLVPTRSLYGEHATSLCGKGKSVRRADFYELARQADLSPDRVAEALEAVDDALCAWPATAKNAGVRRPPAFRPIS